MKRNFLTVIIFCISFLNPVQCLFAAKHEMRAMWLTTLGGLDWPSTYAHDGLGIELQKRELCELLDKYVEAGINTVLFQSRVRGTTIYPSAMEPWEASLSGTAGSNPGYDALAYAISECHKRGLQLHAWVVTIPLGKWSGAGCVNMRSSHPSLVKKIGDEGFMNPENAGTAKYLADICKEIVSNYDVDGIHLDYIRYPETWGRIPNKLQARNNITHIVREIHKAVKNIRPWVMLSCSPIGKYDDTKRAWAHGWNARDAVCQDAALWCREGLMDALFPMMYFKDNNFYPFLVDWQERSAGSLIVPGLGVYFMHPSEKNWPLIDITREMQVSRTLGMGVCFFRSKFFTDNTKGLFDYTKDIYSKTSALIPPLRGGGRVNIDSPSELSIKQKDGNTFALEWGYSECSEEKILYNVYGDTTRIVDTSNPENLLASYYDEKSIRLPSTRKIKFFAVTAVNKYGDESQPVYFAEETESKDEVNTPRQPFCRNGYLYLNDFDVTAGDLLEIKSQVGTSCLLRIVKQIDTEKAIDISTLPIGHYTLYLMNKKGFKHILSRFSKDF